MALVSLTPMDDAQFAEFMEAIVPAYITERVAADHVTEEAAARFVAQQHARLLADGLQTCGHHFFSIVSKSTGHAVGGAWLWIDGQNHQAFLYNITIAQDHRRKGYATAALALLETRARDAGCATLGLNVFASNAAAMKLYHKLGFQSVSSYWNKLL